MNYYDHIAPSYNELHGQEQQDKIAYIKTLTTLPEGTLLDVGCGTGISTICWDKKATGIDPSQELITIAKTTYPNTTFIQASAENIPFQDNFFDTVVSLTAIQNFENLQKGLKEIQRVGKSTFILTFLKKSSKREYITSKIQEIWPDVQWYEQQHDVIAIIKNR